MKTQRIVPKVGDIFEVALADSGKVMYGQVLNWGMMGFYSTDGERLSPAEVVKKDVAFRARCVVDPLEDGVWPVIGNVEPPAAMKRPVSFWRKSAADFYFVYTWNPDKDENERRVAVEEIRGLEQFRSWSPEWIAERLNYFLRGEPSPRANVG